MLYSLKDITLIPAIVSDINSRSECNPFYGNHLPIFSAPMSQIIDEKNWEEFDSNGVNTIIPRNIDIETRLNLCHKTFSAFSLDEFETYFCADYLLGKSYVLIDVANGHMKKVLDLCAKAKELHGDEIVIMAGNVANSATYNEYSMAGVDYCRLGIAGGSQCTTGNTGIYCPMASLIKDVARIKRDILALKAANNLHPRYKSIPKIVADGGFESHGDIIKALALGADYVMLGKIFAMTFEACADVKIDKNNLVWREYYGMSTKRAQKEFGKEGIKTEEGISSWVPVQYILKNWTAEFADYLKSAMSYTGHRTLEEFIGNVQYDILSPTAIRTFK